MKYQSKTNRVWKNSRLLTVFGALVLSVQFATASESEENVEPVSTGGSYASGGSMASGGATAYESRPEKLGSGGMGTGGGPATDGTGGGVAKSQ